MAGHAPRRNAPRRRCLRRRGVLGPVDRADARGDHAAEERVDTDPDAYTNDDGDRRCHDQSSDRDGARIDSGADTNSHRRIERDIDPHTDADAGPRADAHAARDCPGDAALTRVMNTRTFRAMNTDWWIGTVERIDLAPMEHAVHEAEQRFSRFLVGSSLSLLNRDRVRRDSALAEIVRYALAMHEVTDGAFDARVGAAMNAAGYDRTFERLPSDGVVQTLAFAPPIAALHIDVNDDEVRLDSVGTIDLGGIAKGWTVDRVSDALERAGCRNYLVDGGGDIRAAGCDECGEPWVVGIGEGLAVRLQDAAVCTSSTRRRRWSTRRVANATDTAVMDAHHIIDPATGAPSRSAIVEAVVIADRATLADVLATTVIAAPDRGLRAVDACGASALVLQAGRWEMTPGMERWLT